MFNVNYHLKRNLFHCVMFLQIGLYQYLTFFCLNQYILATFFIKKIVKCIRKKLKFSLVMDN